MRKAVRHPSRAATARCAIYTRKSSEEGLEQSFNSLDAQREACEAYVASQRSEGWMVLPKMYDDGGFSGGSMDRPALKQLLADVEAGLIDTVVVYKVDRLTRSLGDFAKIVDVFDAAGASFVSVTQSFNTTTSMGRLTLNMLLSFAQFEREVTGERIRDKIAASKAKGMWMGGRPPLGYEVRDRKLQIVKEEAETVRHIFKRYADLKSVMALREELAFSGIAAKRHVSASGNVTGGGQLGRGALYDLLQNRLYRGEINHKGTIYPGQHEPIVSEEVWEKVQSVLAESKLDHTVRPRCSSPSLLAGLVRDEDGVPLTPIHANKRTRRYRYYVSNDLVVGPKRIANETKRRRSSARRIPAPDLESIVEGRLMRFLGDTAAVDEVIATQARDVSERRELIAKASDFARRWPTLPVTEKIVTLQMLVKGIVVKSATIDMTISIAGVVALARDGLEDDRRTIAGTEEDDGETITLSMPAVLKRVGLEMRYLVDADQASVSRQPDRSLLRLIARAHLFRELMLKGDGQSITQLSEASGVTPSYFTRVVRLGFLAPDITAAILQGQQPIGLSAQHLSLANLPKDWIEQRQALGLT